MFYSDVSLTAGDRIHFIMRCQMARLRLRRALVNLDELVGPKSVNSVRKCLLLSPTLNRIVLQYRWLYNIASEQCSVRNSGFC